MTNAEKIRSIESDEELAEFLTDIFGTAFSGHREFALRIVRDWLKMPAKD